MPKHAWTIKDESLNLFLLLEWLQSLGGVLSREIHTDADGYDFVGLTLNPNESMLKQVGVVVVFIPQSLDGVNFFMAKVRTMVFRRYEWYERKPADAVAKAIFADVCDFVLPEIPSYIQVWEKKRV